MTSYVNCKFVVNQRLVKTLLIFLLRRMTRNLMAIANLHDMNREIVNQSLISAK